MQVRRPTRTLLAALAATAALVGTAGAAAAADSTPTAASSAKPAAKPKGDGARALCKRVPRIDRRIDRALRRLDAGAGRRGSVARIQQRVDNAKKAGHDEIATFLQDRLDFRVSLQKNLEQRQKDLTGVKTWCQANDGGKAAG
ncbi:hypothetical protein OIB37_24995 [Streptomyces sp. NBC_00820]|uniref:hypothetical protein n=1 Tax=Streptomyces sp. NBC_00820 TaxID=2975842 RepID=UPI002ED214D2|nr:hypothetical protein OIB37_24995 [Streptomyces sp. NBC_00820]